MHNGKYHNSLRDIFRSTYTPIHWQIYYLGNHKMNADGLLSSILPLTRSNNTLSRSLSTMYEMAKPWGQRTPHFNCLVPTHFDSILSRNLATIFTHVGTCHECNLQRYKRDCPLWVSGPCYEHHTPVVNVNPSYEPVACSYFKYCTCGAFHLRAPRVINTLTKCVVQVPWRDM